MTTPKTYYAPEPFPAFLWYNGGLSEQRSGQPFYRGVFPMLDLLKEMFSYPFMVRAILVGTIVALCSSLLGVSLVLKRYS